MVVKVNGVPKAAGRYARYLFEEAQDIDRTYRIRLFGTAALMQGVLGRPLNWREFQNLAAGFSPDGRTRLGRAHRHRRWGFEVLLHVPSGVGKAGEVLSDADYAKLTKAIEKAVHDTMRFLERRAARTRVTANGVKRREPVELLYTFAQHARNRNGELSPHAHVVVFSRGRRPNGTWAALENRHFYDAQRAAKGVFNQALAYHITHDLGLRVVRHKESIRVKGVDGAWAKTTRREEVKREQRRTGRTDAKGATHAALKTRKPKPRPGPNAKAHQDDGKTQQKGKKTRQKDEKSGQDQASSGGRTESFAEVRRKWRDAAHALGRYAADLGRRAWAYCADLVEQRRADRCYQLGVKYCAATVSRFGGQKVDEAAAFFATGRNISPDALAAAGERFHANPRRFGLAVTESRLGQPKYASKRRVSREEKLFAELGRLGAKRRCGLTDRQIARGLCGGPADLETLRAVRQLAAKQGVVAGESHRPTDQALRLTVRTYRDEHRPVLAVGQTPASAGRLRQALDVQTYSAGDLVEKLLTPTHWRCLKAAFREARGTPHERAAYAERLRRSALKLPKGCLVVTDLGPSDVAELRALVKAVRQAKGKLVFTGPASAEIRAGLDSRQPQQQQSHTAGRTRSRRAGR